MKKLITPLFVIATAVALILSVLPFGTIALIPIALAVVLGILLYLNLKKTDSKPNMLHRLTYLVLAISIAISVYRIAFEENTVADQELSIEKAEESLEDAKEELEDLEDLDSIE